MFDIDADLSLAMSIMSGAEEIAMNWFGRVTGVSRKADRSPVSEADLAIERYVLRTYA